MVYKFTKIQFSIHIYFFALISLLTSTSIFSQNQYSNIRFHKTHETLHKIMDLLAHKEPGLFLRFGDGDVNLAIGEPDLLQASSSNLQQEMREALGLNGDGIIKTLPLLCKELDGWEEGMFPGNHEWDLQGCINLLNQTSPFWGKPFTDVYSTVALHFAATHYKTLCIRFLRFLKQSKPVILIGNKNVPSEIRNLLFDTQCAFIPTPARQSFNAIDSIEKACLNAIPQDGSYHVAIIAMGCSGRVLSKRLWSKLNNVFIFDFGSLLDALCGWNTRAWIELSDFQAKQILSKMQSSIRVVCTAALIKDQEEQRKKEYIDSLNTLLSYGMWTYVLESCSSENFTFLDQHAGTVYYTKTNDPTLRNKGVNEALSLINGFSHFQFNDNDMVIKLTGRYHCNTDTIIKLVEENPEYDAIIKKDAHGQVFTGCFAMRYFHFKNMLESFDFNSMEKNMINLEQKVADYLASHPNIRVLEVQKIDVSARIGNGDTVYQW